jgi:D-alanyl-D-alanine dipeptidase
MINAALVSIAPPAFDVELALAYATADNITGKPIYQANAGCYLHKDAAACLQEAIRLAAQLGLRFKIFDAYRPTEAQWLLWNHNPDPEFLTDPRRGSPHSRGVAVDLTLIDAKGAELEMGTAFDDFTAHSHHGNTEINPEAQRNRHLLMGIMSTAGWDFYRNEWWHYQLFNARRDYALFGDEEAGTAMM